MTGKAFNGNPAAFLIFILPLAAVIVLLYKAWMWILGFVALIVVWKLIDNYQWQQWCTRMNPIFNQLLQQNQGRITPLDLSLKADLSAGSAKRFLARKAQEYGANYQELPEQGRIYFFITASTLGSIFDDSEPLTEEAEPEKLEDLWDDEEEEIDIPETYSVTEKTPTISEATPPQPLSSPFAQLAELKEERQQLNQAVSETPSLSDLTPVSEISSDHLLPTEESPEPPPPQETETVTNPETKQKFTLIQVDLAKRLDTTPSTIGRRKGEANFSEWSQSKDPDGIAWKYLRKSKVFIPVDPEKRQI
ncbi:hypothetical protein [Crocosphaera sp. XPORK-15E]|uniref:hypothetical protein n=1 Tax=Crocosphaera sp. XPORK-15E TaxID=3110247 RepID=UPI002B207954|nr:hypothetical protein [Crocosphaera sp. XPORK-15E]MEA5535654.1 hypothetical protein [Crocosphaera sp. XPORK-15E]